MHALAQIGLALALAATLALPAASAERATGVEGDARGNAAPVLDGVGNVSVAAGILDLTGPALDGALRVAWSSASGTTTTRSGTLTAGAHYSSADWNKSAVSWSGGNLTRFHCAEACVVRLVLDPETQGRLGLRGQVVGEPGFARQANLASGEVPTPEGDVRISTRVHETWLVAQARPGAPGYALADGVPLAEGAARLELWNVTATRAWDEGSEEIFAGMSRTARPAPVGPPMQEEIVIRSLVVELRDVQVWAAPGVGALLAAPGLDVQLDGVASWPSSHGRIAVDGRETELRGEHLAIDGPGLALVVGLSGPASGTTSALVSPPTRTLIAGEATSVRVDGRELVRSTEGVAPAIVLPAAGALGVVGVLWMMARSGALAALYARVTSSHVLTNPNRRAAYEVILARPGMHVSEISRAIDVGRVVLQHHLRMLELHRLVVARTVGRFKTYYPSSRLPDYEAARANATLKDASRSRVLAEIQASREGLTQKEIVMCTGLSQRLVSYHVARLEEARLVRGDAERPRRFTVGPRAPLDAALEARAQS